MPNTKLYTLFDSQFNVEEIIMGAKKTNNLKFMDFCAGIGAGRLGLENLGLKCVGFSEIDKNSERTYREFFGQEEKQRYEHQIKNVTIDLIVEMVSLLYEVHRGITVNVNPQVLLENYVIKSIRTHADIERAKQNTT